MQFDTIEVSVDGARGALVLNRPEKLNPLSSHTLGEIEAAARWFDGFDESEGRRRVRSRPGVLGGCGRVVVRQWHRPGRRPLAP